MGIKTLINKTKKWLSKNYSDLKKNAKNFWKKIKDDQTAVARGKPEHFKPGTMLTFTYSAKHKEHQFDKYPLVLALGPSKKHKGLYLGINLHWIGADGSIKTSRNNPNGAVRERVVLAEMLLKKMESKKGLTYDDVKAIVKHYQKSKYPILRSYYLGGVSNVRVIPGVLYKSAAAIPNERIIIK